MIASYKGLGLDDLAERSQEVFALNYPNAEPRQRGQATVVSTTGEGARLHAD